MWSCNMLPFCLRTFISHQTPLFLIRQALGAETKCSCHLQNLQKLQKLDEGLMNQQTEKPEGGATYLMTTKCASHLIEVA